MKRKCEIVLCSSALFNLNLKGGCEGLKEEETERVLIIESALFNLNLKVGGCEGLKEEETVLRCLKDIDLLYK